MEALIGQENELIFMQNNASRHAAKKTVALIASLAIKGFKWPFYSLDLNPLETVWRYMKEFLYEEYGDLKFRNCNDLKQKITRAWKTVVTPGLLRQ